MSEYAYDAYDKAEAIGDDRESAVNELKHGIERLRKITDSLETRLEPVLRSPHPVSAETAERVQASSPLRNLSADLFIALDRLGYVADRIDL